MSPHIYPPILEYAYRYPMNICVRVCVNPSNA